MSESFIEIYYWYKIEFFSNGNQFISVHNAVVTAAIFAPNPAMLRPNSKRRSAEDSQEDEGEVIVTADFTGALKVVRNLKGSLHHKTEEKPWPNLWPVCSF